MYTQSKHDVELENLIQQKGTQYKEIFYEECKIQQDSLEWLKMMLDYCKKNNLEQSKELWNVACYVYITSFDLTIITENLYLTQNEWGRRFFARQSALLIYEAIDDIMNLTGKKFRNMLEQLENAAELKVELKAISTNMNEYKNHNYLKLQQIRNKSAAHRDHDCTDLLKTIGEINWSGTVELSRQFNNILSAYANFMHLVIKTNIHEIKNRVS